VPGAGYWACGQRVRALTVGLSILAIFILGVLIGGIRVVDAPRIGGDVGYIAPILQKPWFIGQFFTGPISLIAAWWSSSVAADPVLKTMNAHGRLADIGTLYTAVAGMLNLMATIDAAHRAAREEA
jgi:hypothetical protein